MATWDDVNISWNDMPSAVKWNSTVHVPDVSMPSTASLRGSMKPTFRETGRFFARTGSKFLNVYGEYNPKVVLTSRTDVTPESLASYNTADASFGFGSGVEVDEFQTYPLKVSLGSSTKFKESNKGSFGYGISFDMATETATSWGSIYENKVSFNSKAGFTEENKLSFEYEFWFTTLTGFMESNKFTFGEDFTFDINLGFDMNDYGWLRDKVEEGRWSMEPEFKQDWVPENPVKGDWSKGE